ncbi:MAG: S9 family peptidase [Candidatus Eremiobacteraeota bacterium]|nr:S9 family peptidase [Candidatus Eremiobacteraeota bacterium]
MKRVLLGLALTTAGWSQPLMTPQLVAKLRAVSSVQVSGDGRSAIYTLSQPRLFEREDFEDGPAYSEVYRLSASGSQPLLTQRSGASWVGFTPDDRALTFLSKRSGDDHTCVYRLPLDGGEAQRILAFGSDVAGFAVSPQGNRIAFLANAPADPKREKMRKLGFTAQVFEEDWQFRKLYLAQQGSDKIKAEPVALEGSIGSVEWSPDGALLAVTSAPNPGVDADLMYRRIQLLDARTGKLLQTLKNPGKLGQFAFAPDGKHLALLTGEDLNDPDNGRLWLADTASGSMRDLWPNLDGRVSKVAWLSPSKLRALVWKGLVSEVWDVTTDGKRTLVVPAGEEVLTDLAVAETGRTLYVSESARHPGEVSEDGKLLTHLNPVLDKLRWAKQEAYTYKARDGQSIEGVLIHPLEETAGQRYPLILWVHGGPEGLIHNSWNNGYSQPGQVAAARGFASFYPNYRGSIGRSVAFSKLGQGDPAGREFEDLVDGVDALINQGLVDKAKVGVTGGSYGGYATAWCSTFFSDRFACGVMSVGISDKVSKSGTTDIPDEEFLVHARKHPWDNWNFFMERSPIHHVTKHHTPLLIMHGKDDPRVHPSQSLELYRYLKMLKQAPVRLVLYPGEGHGNRKAAARYDFQLRMMEWMEHYLKGSGGAAPNWDLPIPLDKPES